MPEGKLSPSWVGCIWPIAPRQRCMRSGKGKPARIPPDKAPTSFVVAHWSFDTERPAFRAGVSVGRNPSLPVVRRTENGYNDKYGDGATSRSIKDLTIVCVDHAGADSRDAWPRRAPTRSSPRQCDLDLRKEVRPPSNKDAACRNPSSVTLDRGAGSLRDDRPLSDK